MASVKVNRTIDTAREEFYPISARYYRKDLIYIRDNMAKPNGLTMADMLRSIVHAVVEDDRKAHEAGK